MNESNQTRIDGWANVLTGMGLVGKDQSKSTFYLRDCKLQRQQLDQMYYGDGIVKAIVNVIPEMMLCKGFDIEGDQELYVKAKLDQLRALDKLIEMMYWSRLYGGSLIVLGLEDGRDTSEPVDLRMLRDIKWMHVFDRYQCDTLTSENLDCDVNSPNYGFPLVYPVRMYDQSTTIYFHHSRVLRMDGIEIPGRLRRENQGWGESEIQACYQQIVNYVTGYKNTAQMIQDFIQVIFSIEDLAQWLNCDNKEKVMMRMQLIAECKSVYNMVVKDSKEGYEKISTSVSGVPDILDRFMMDLSAVTRIPVSLLFGRSAAGLNSTGEHDVSTFYDYVIQQQEKKLRPVLEKLISYIFLCKDGPFNGLEPENWCLTFKPLTETSPLDEMNLRKAVAETDRTYIELGVLTPEEVRESRFGSGVYNYNTTLDPQSSLELDPEINEEIYRSVYDKKDEKEPPSVESKLIEYLSNQIMSG